MIVYAVIHSDIDDREVRGLFSTEEAAQAVVTLIEAHERGADPSKPQPYGGHYFYPHGDWCCDVVPMDVADEPPEVFHGPPVPPDLKAEWSFGSRLVSDAMTERLIDHLTQPSVLDLLHLHGRDIFKGPVGTVEDISETEDGITVKARLDK